MVAADEKTYEWIAKHRPGVDAEGLAARAVAPDPDAVYAGGVHTICSRSPPCAPEDDVLERLTGIDPTRCPKGGQGRLKHWREFPRPGSWAPSTREPP